MSTTELESRRNERFDAVVLGAGPAGEVAKTLLRQPEVRNESTCAAGFATPALDWAQVAAYRDWMIRDLDDTATVGGYEQRGVTVLKGAGKLAGPGRVEVEGRLLESDHVVLATGSDPMIPSIEGLDEVGYWTNREATTLKEIPASTVFIGGGPVGIELGQMLARSTRR